MVIKLLGRRWTIKIVQGMDTRGECDDPGETDQPEIWISSELSGEEKLEVMLHEMLHACGWHMFSEEWVTSASEDIAAALYRMGVECSE